MCQEVSREIGEVPEEFKRSYRRFAGRFRDAPGGVLRFKRFYERSEGFKPLGRYRGLRGVSED